MYKQFSFVLFPFSIYVYRALSVIYESLSCFKLFLRLLFEFPTSLKYKTTGSKSFLLLMDDTLIPYVNSNVFLYTYMLIIMHTCMIARLCTSITTEPCDLTLLNQTYFWNIWYCTKCLCKLLRKDKKLLSSLSSFQ